MTVTLDGVSPFLMHSYTTNYNGGGLMARTCALNLESHGSSRTTVGTRFSFPLFNLNALEFAQLYPIK